MLGRTENQLRPSKLKIAILIVLFSGLLIAIVQGTNRVSGETTEPSFPTPNWIEPRGISVLDAVGEVPESHLRDLILIYQASQGVIQYSSGQRNGNTVTINAKVSFHDTNKILCLGMAGRFDEWPVVVPDGTMRVFSNGNDVTHRVESSYLLYPAGLHKPTDGTKSLRRYASQTATTQRDNQGHIVIPANMGCEFDVSGGSLRNVTVEFTFNSPKRIKITPIHHESGQKYSWIGPRGTNSALGVVAGLNNQLWSFNDAHAGRGQYSDIGKLADWGRNDGYVIEPSDVADADYVLHKYPPMPVNVYIDENANSTNPSIGGGSWRINSGKNDYLPSVDHTAGVLIPLRGNWRDSDQSGGSSFLSFFSKFSILTVPEYIVPPGVEYHPCMSNGGCSNAVLASIFRTQFPTDVYFYKVERISADLEQISLKSVGPGWNRSAREVEADVEELLLSMTHKIFIPAVEKAAEPPPDNPNLNCPCGWFDEIGRMYDYVPPK